MGAIDNARQNHPELVVGDVMKLIHDGHKAHGIETAHCILPFEIRNVLKFRGVNKWLAVRRMLIQLKDRWLKRIHEMTEEVQELKPKGDRWFRWTDADQKILAGIDNLVRPGTTCTCSYRVSKECEMHGHLLNAVHVDRSDVLWLLDHLMDSVKALDEMRGILTVSKKYHQAKGYLKALHECRAQVRTLCYSSRDVDFPENPRDFGPGCILPSTMPAMPDKRWLLRRGGFFKVRALDAERAERIALTEMRDARKAAGGDRAPVSEDS